MRIHEIAHPPKMDYHHTLYQHLHNTPPPLEHISLKQAPQMATSLDQPVISRGATKPPTNPYQKEPNSSKNKPTPPPFTKTCKHCPILNQSTANVKTEYPPQDVEEREERKFTTPPTSICYRNIFQTSSPINHPLSIAFHSTPMPTLSHTTHKLMENRATHTQGISHHTATTRQHRNAHTREI